MQPILVTGASGFLGGAIASELLNRGYPVRAFARREMPDLAERGAEIIRGDLADANTIAEAVRGCQTVFHSGAKTGIWGSRQSYIAANVDGTRHVIAACRCHRVEKLIFTSSPSVVHAGRDIVFGDESLPHSRHFSSHYAATKAAAEEMVLASNGPTLATIALRPHLIWGPGDRHLLPRLVERAKRGWLFFPGNGRARIDSTYIDSAVEAHLLAANRLHVGAACAGKAYFVSQGEPLEIRDLVQRLISAVGERSEAHCIPLTAALVLAAVCETLWRMLDLPSDPPLTRFVARQMATSHFFNLDAVRRDLGYGPIVSLQEGLARLSAYHAASTPSRITVSI